MNYQRIFWLFVFIALAACKKDYPDSSNGTPVFYFNGTISGNPVNLQAGINDYYMHSSFVQDTNNVYNFQGDFKQTNCIANCTNRIQFQINDYKVSVLNAPAVMDSSLLPGYYPLQVPGGAQIAYPMHFIAFSSNTALTYSWDFGDGATSASANPFHVFSHPGSYHVCLTITYSGSCTSSLCNQVKVGIPDAASSAAIINYPGNGNTVLFSALATGAPPFTYLWDFGDGDTSASQYVTHTYSIPGIYKVRLQVKDADNYFSDAYKYVSTQGFQGCFTNFHFYAGVEIQNLYSFSNVTITWTDNSGIVYTSNNSSQPGDSYFQIVSVDNYLNNKDNQPTKKLHVKFKCKAFNGNYSHQIEDGDAVIAVSYK